MSATSTWADVISSLQNALIGVIKGVADALAAHATTIGTVIVGIGIAYMVYRLAGRITPLFGQILGGLRL